MFLNGSSFIFFTIVFCINRFGVVVWGKRMPSSKSEQVYTHQDQSGNIRNSETIHSFQISINKKMAGKNECNHVYCICNRDVSLGFCLAMNLLSSQCHQRTEYILRIHLIWKKIQSAILLYLTPSYQTNLTNFLLISYVHFTLGSEMFPVSIKVQGYGYCHLVSGICVLSPLGSK